MGTNMGPNYACLFVGYVERKMLEDYKGNKTQLYKRYIDDVLGASSGTRQDLENFTEFCSAYHPSLKYTFEISDSSLSPPYCKKAILYGQFLRLRRIRSQTMMSVQGNGIVL